MVGRLTISLGNLESFAQSQHRAVGSRIEAKMSSKLTPMLQQYTAIKREHPDVILMFRLGDFYEMFGDDAKIAAQELEITLTSREAGGAGRIPMCGVPYHSVDRYVARLISRGYRVAICDQVEDPKQAKGLVKREVTRVITPGTVLEDAMLDATSNNYLVAPARRQETFGLAVIDISTGEFLVTEMSGDGAEQRLLEEIGRLSPAEVLVPEEADELTTRIQEACNARFTQFALDGFMSAKDILLKHFGTASLRGFDCEDYSAGIDAAASIIKYLESTQPTALNHARSLATYSTSGFMVLDAVTRRNLELTQSLFDGSKSKSLLEILDLTTTSMGGRLLRKWLEQPLLDVSAIHARLDAVEELHGNLLMRSNLRETFQKIADLERLTSRIAARTANARDLIALRDSLAVLPEVGSALGNSENAVLRDLAGTTGGLEHVAEMITGAVVEEPPVSLREGGLIKSGFNKDLDTLRSKSDTIRSSATTSK